MTTGRLSEMTPDELKALIREAVRAEFSAVGMRVDDGDDQDEAREDFRFLRRVRRGVDSTANKLGYTIIIAIAAGLVSIFTIGFNALWGKS